MTEITVRTAHHCQFVNIDRQVQQVVTDSGVSEGICHVFIPHTTAGITINENADPEVVRDPRRHPRECRAMARGICPWRREFRGPRQGEPDGI